MRTAFLSLAVLVASLQFVAGCAGDACSGRTDVPTTREIELGDAAATACEPICTDADPNTPLASCEITTSTLGTRIARCRYKGQTRTCS